MSIQGNIQTFYLSTLLQLLSNDKKTGILTVNNAEDTIRMYLSEGTIVYASSSREEERLGNFLVHEGLIEKSVIETSLTTARLSEKKIGDILVAEKHIDAETLAHAVGQQIEFMLYNLFLWEQGDFVYEDCPVSLPENTTTAFDTMELILEASRRVDELSVLKKHLPDPHAVLTRTPGIDPAALNLSADEIPVFNLVNDRRTVHQLINDSGYDDFSICKILYSLMCSGIIGCSEQSSNRPAAITFSETIMVSGQPHGTHDTAMPARESPAADSTGADVRAIITTSSPAWAIPGLPRKIPALVTLAAMAVCLACAGAAYIVFHRSTPPAVVPASPALTSRVPAPSADEPVRAALPDEHAAAAPSAGAPAQPHRPLDVPPGSTNQAFNAPVVFTSPGDVFTLMLPGNHTVTDKSAGGVQQFVIAFNKNVTMTIRAQSRRNAWVPEDEMFRRILEIQETHGSTQPIRIDTYSLTSIGGAQGYEIAYTNSTASLPYKVLTYTLVRKDTAIFLDIFYTNFRNTRIRELVREIQKLIATTLVILA